MKKETKAVKRVKMESKSGIMSAKKFSQVVSSLSVSVRLSSGFESWPDKYSIIFKVMMPTNARVETRMYR